MIITTKVTNKTNLFPNIRAFFGDNWIESKIQEFYRSRTKLSEKNPYNAAIQNLEKHLHPLIRDVIRQVDPKLIEFDLVDLVDSKGKWELRLLERDLSILSGDISISSKVLSDYKNELPLTRNYDQRRFELFIATNFKLAGYKVNFVERNAQRTCEFEVTSPVTNNEYLVECKQRYQKEPDYQREKFLYLLTEIIFPELIKEGINNKVIEVNWSGSVQYGDVKVLSKLIINNIKSHSDLYYRFSYKQRYDIILRTYKQPLPQSLKDLQRDIPHFVTTADAYMCVDKGLYLSIARDFNQGSLSKLKALYQDAKSQIRTGGNTFIYIDINTMPVEILTQFMKNLQSRPPQDIGALIVLKHQLHVTGSRQIIFSPFPQVMWNKKLIPSQIDILLSPGFRGESGFDDYLTNI